jgi:MFS superfamily sulfate permease-like transporter
LTWVYVIGFTIILTAINVIEQVMSNAAIEKIDPLGRRCSNNNSLFAIWIANIGSSFFGGMTNLDGLAKSTSNALAGAVTKFSVLVIGVVVAFFVMNSQYLEYLPKFSLAAIMIFTGWKMISRLWNVAYHGQYAMILAIACSLLVYKVGIFEGLLIAIAVHGLVNYLVFHQAGKIPTKVIIKKYMKKFSGDEGID